MRPSPARRRTGRAAVAVVLASVLAACTAEGLTPEPAEVAPDPLGLVGLWRVGGDDVAEGTWLRLTTDMLAYATGDASCPGAVGGGWAAGDGLLVLGPITMATGHCGVDAFETGGAPWLAQVAGFREGDEGWELLDHAGEMVARLTPDAVVPVGVDDWYREVPEPGAQARERFASPAPLPEGLRAPAAEELVGRWVPTERYDTEPHAELAADGTWFGSDGCNGLRAGWALGGEGRFLATTGPMTLIGCDGAGVPHWVSDAARVGFDGEELVLLDREGTELGRLVRG